MAVVVARENVWPMRNGSLRGNLERTNSKDPQDFGGGAKITPRVKMRRDRVTETGRGGVTPGRGQGGTNASLVWRLCEAPGAAATRSGLSPLLRTKDSATWPTTEEALSTVSSHPPPPPRST